MNWFSPNVPHQEQSASAAPRHLSNLGGHLPSPVHHDAAHGLAHDFRQRLADAVLVGDLDAVHAHIAHAERDHLVPPAFGEMLDFCWGPGPNTHEWRLGLSAAINQALNMAKQYYSIMNNLLAAKSMPLTAELEEYYKWTDGVIDSLEQAMAKIPPGARHDRCAVSLERLKSAARRDVADAA